MMSVPFLLSKNLIFFGQLAKKEKNAIQSWASNKRGTLAQLVEQRTFNPLVTSSNLVRPTKHTKETLLSMR